MKERSTRELSKADEVLLRYYAVVGRHHMRYCVCEEMRKRPAWYAELILR
jgi:hypothetical protein